MIKLLFWIVTPISLLIGGTIGGIFLFLPEPDLGPPNSYIESPRPTSDVFSISTSKPVSSPVTLSSNKIVLQPTPETDPIVNCNSKTGIRQIRLSQCKASADCPDGNAGYFFTSKENCDKYWQSIKDKFAQLGKDLSNAYQEQFNLQREYYSQAGNSVALPNPADYSDLPPITAPTQTTPIIPQPPNPTPALAPVPLNLQYYR